MIKYIKGSGGGCFPAGSKVSTPDGFKEIDKLEIGDLVLSFDYSGRISTSKVTELHVHENEEIYEYEYWGGNIKATANHWVLNQYNAFVEIGSLSFEDSLVDINNHLRPLISSKYITTTTVYNLTVEDDHTYILEGIRVHNGGGGKGGGGRVAVEDPDSLRSIEYAKVVDLVSEGEIGGLVDGLKSIYLDETPIQNADDSLNFSGIVFTSVNGTQDQSSLPGFGGTYAETAVSTEIKSAANPKISFKGKISGTTLTVTAVTSGVISQYLDISGNGISANTYITALGTGTGAEGTYILNKSANIFTVQDITGQTTNAIFTGSISGTTLTVTAVAHGTIDIGEVITGGGITGTTYIEQRLTGTGGVGTYLIAGAIKYTTVASTTMYSQIPGSVTRNIINSNLDAIRVTIGIPQLTYQDMSTGDIHGSTINLSIELSTDNGASYKLMPISTEDVGSKLTTNTGITKCSVASSYFKLVVKWNGLKNPVGTWGWNSYGILTNKAYTGNPLQQHTTILQYRVLGNTAWTSYATINFSGKTTTTTSYSGVTSSHMTMSGPVMDYGFGSGTPTVQTHYATGSKTFTLELPEAQYEFRLLDTVSSGSVYIDLTTSTARVYRNYDIISGKTISKYQRSYRINVPPGFSNYLIRVNKETPDSTKSALVNKVWWDSYTEIIDDKLSYPNSALMAISVDASQFNRIPTRSFDIYGIKVKIPSNYNPYTREYTGIWDGTFIVDWTNNPAWIFYDLVTNTRYGLGNYLSTSMLDKWNLYSIGQYCDEFVPDGISNSGYEPRFTCNLYLQTQEDAFRVINNLASVFRAITYWNNSTLMVSQDKPADSAAIFTPANVIDGMFTYQGSSLKARHTTVLVSWNDPTDNYKTKIEYVEDLEGIQKYGVIETQIAAMGCTSRGQAHRLGKWLLYTERYETETVTFKTGLDGALVYPGAIIQTYDAFRTGNRFGGRISSATTNIINIDKPITLTLGKNYKISCTLPNGTVEVRSIVNTGDTTNILRTSSDFSDIPQGIWILAEWVTLTAGSTSFNELVIDTWRVVSITESAVNELEITAVEHHPEKFLEIERNIDFQSISTVPFANSILTPTNLQITETLYISSVNSIGIKLHLFWEGSATSYKVMYKPTQGNWTTLITNTPNIDIFGDIIEGEYIFKVSGLNSLNIESPASESLIYTVLGKTIPPTDIIYTNASTNAYGVYLDWEPCTDVDFSYYELREGTVWETATLIATNIKESNYQIDYPSVGVHNYLVKAVDTTGNYSLNA